MTLYSERPDAAFSICVCVCVSPADAYLQRQGRDLHFVLFLVTVGTFSSPRFLEKIASFKRARARRVVRPFHNTRHRTSLLRTLSLHPRSKPNAIPNRVPVVGRWPVRSPWRPRCVTSPRLHRNAPRVFFQKETHASVSVLRFRKPTREILCRFSQVQRRRIDALSANNRRDALCASQESRSLTRLISVSQISLDQIYV